VPGRVDGKVAFVTGIARGQGRAHAVRLAEEGADVIGLDLAAPVPSMGYAMGTPQELAETVAAVEATGRRIVAGTADVRDRAAVDAVLDDGLEAFGRLDVVVASAGISPPGRRMWEIPPDEWRDVVDTNLTGVWNTLSAAVPRMLKARNGGSIVVISSGAGLKGVPNLSGYSATKAAVVSLAKSLANEVAHRGIRVNVVAPGTVDTPMVTENVQQFRIFRPDLPDPTLEDCVETFRSINPMGLPWIDPVEIANAVLFLASDDSRFITGVVLPVDQGNAARP
jgi:(+)-trans-carveol dehydrogenase